MINIFDKFSFILAFMIFIIFFNMVFGEKVTQGFLTLVLVGMVIINAETMTNLFKNLGGE